jgi:L-ascorbate metabolism protein UlaG (beta-lactamase superfamily)
MATFRIETPGGKTVIIDPWVMNNPMCPEAEKIYHAGDTNVFGDMAIIHELYAPEIVMPPVGDHYIRWDRAKQLMPAIFSNPRL